MASNGNERAHAHCCASPPECSCGKGMDGLDPKEVSQTAVSLADALIEALAEGERSPGLPSQE
jgi:hypothetical protein